MARTLPTLLSPIDAYMANQDRPMVYLESGDSDNNISSIYVKAYMTSGSNASGVTGYFETHIAGTSAGHTYGFGSWINIEDAAVLAAGHIHVPFEGGVYEGAATMTNARIVFAGQHQAILTGTPASLHAWRLNTTKTITALIAAANAGSIGFAASAGTTSTKNGDIAIADVVGTGVVYVRTYNAAG